MKRRVLRSKANKQVMRVVTSAFALRPRDPLVIIVDASFARAVFEAKGQRTSESLRGLLAECLGREAMRIFHTCSTLELLRRQGSENAAASLAKETRCFDDDATSAQPKREARSVFEAAQAMLGMGEAPTAFGAPVRHVFVATQSHDMRRELTAVFPAQRRSSSAAAGTPGFGAAPVSIIRASMQPLALWIASLHDEGPVGSVRIRKSSRDAGDPGAAPQSPPPAPAAPRGPAVGPADFAFMQKLSVKVPHGAPLAPSVQAQLQEREDARIRKAAAAESMAPGITRAEGAAKAGIALTGNSPKKIVKNKQQQRGVNPLASKKKQPKLRVIAGDGTPVKAPRQLSSHSSAGPAVQRGAERRTLHLAPPAAPPRAALPESTAPGAASVSGRRRPHRRGGRRGRHSSSSLKAENEEQPSTQCA